VSPAMPAITFPAWRTHDDFVPLIEVLLAVGPWTICQVSWAVGDSEFGTGWRGSAELARLAHNGRRVSTRVLVDLVSDGVQLVDGEVSCFHDSAQEPFLVLASVRGDSWDVHSTEQGVLDVVRRCLDQVDELR
jgi:hypothetical protein